MTLCRIFHCSGPIRDGFRLQARMAHLAHKAAYMLVLNLLELCMGKINLGDHILLVFDLNEVSHVVWVLAEAEYRCVYKFGYRAGEGERQTDHTCPETA